MGSTEYWSYNNQLQAHWIPNCKRWCGGASNSNEQQTLHGCTFCSGDSREGQRHRVACFFFLLLQTCICIAGDRLLLTD